MLFRSYGYSQDSPDFWDAVDVHLRGWVTHDLGNLPSTIAAQGSTLTTSTQRVPYVAQRVRLETGELGTVCRVDQADRGSRVFIALDRGMVACLDIPHSTQPAPSSSTPPAPVRVTDAQPIRVGRFQAPPTRGSADQ